MQGHGVWTSSDKECRKSSKALEQESGKIKSVFWEANRRDAERREIRSKGRGLLRAQWGTSVPLRPLCPVRRAFPYDVFTCQPPHTGQ